MGKKVILFALLLLILAGAGFLIKILNKNYPQTLPRGADFFSFESDTRSDEPGCPFKTEERIVRGNSLDPIIQDGDTVKIAFGYYDCNEIKRDDIVLYDYAGYSNPLIKIIKGLAGDSFKLVRKDGGWNILINDEIVKNSDGQEYVLDERGYKMLSLYEKDYKGVIPENAYLLLGNIPSGSLDATHFGLIDKSGILAKVINRD